MVLQTYWKANTVIGRKDFFDFAWSRGDASQDEFICAMLPILLWYVMFFKQFACFFGAFKPSSSNNGKVNWKVTQQLCDNNSNPQIHGKLKVALPKYNNKHGGLPDMQYVWRHISTNCQGWNWRLIMYFSSTKWKIQWYRCIEIKNRTLKYFSTKTLLRFE